MRSIFLCLLISGCGYYVVHGNDARARPREADCKFDIVQLRPDRPFVEVGQLLKQRTDDRLYDLGAFRDEIRPLVCQAGGDAVVAEPTPGGWWTGGAIIAYR